MRYYLFAVVCIFTDVHCLCEMRACFIQLQKLHLDLEFSNMRQHHKEDKDDRWAAFISL